MTKAALWAFAVLGTAVVHVAWLGPRVEPAALALSGVVLLGVAWFGSARQKRVADPIVTPRPVPAGEDRRSRSP